jgi:hypothetical protein
MFPSYIKIKPDNPKKFKLILQKFLYENSLYSLDEYYELQKVKFIYILSQLVFESLVHKIDMHLCLFHFLTTYLVFVSVLYILFSM